MSVSFDRMWSDLASVGREPATGGYRRFAWTRTDHDLREWFAGECAARGLALTEDRAGNQWAWWGDPDAQPGVVIGSHLDSVPDGGAFDGPLGVVSALATIDTLRQRGITPAVPLGVVNFVDEEGARFGVACAGSRIITGALTADRARSLTDADGISMAQAWTAAGRDPESMGPDDEAVNRIACFVELHVEQGKALALAADGVDDLDDPARAVAIGTDIWPHGRWRLDIPGEANHAGTTRLDDRRDAMLGLATVVQSARQQATVLGCVATVGKVRVEPGGVNAISSHVTAWLDARGADEDAVRATVSGVLADSDSLGVEATEESWTPTTAFDAALVSRLRGILPGAPLLGTGAGHDAGVLATHGVPSAMLYVRNPTGISHSPAEHAERRDCHDGVMALTSVVAELVSRPTDRTNGSGQ
ncbi:allantoate amidohydrolase [Humibacillus sp. DSM 29435]|uniref:allantoate amidohydrolase n=1 Tax=Humibacillus sp. DSM 29435 TaxID=1869167 RepID=UPI00087230EC|nr:allantoate amidohydrolase [Humibacillus sp. DSM 29435]OFE15494.1 allantoate amidohydrolase [Humibacillus sp. DSM 29435]